jgi:hypothetical protein
MTNIGFDSSAHGYIVSKVSGDVKNFLWSIVPIILIQTPCHDKCQGDDEEYPQHV